MKKEITTALVSVIIPAFNRIDYIEETINSVFVQDYTAIELIVVDDGSSDGTYELLRAEEKEGKLRLLTHENRANKGQAAAINVGLENANGEFIAILDSDDTFAEGKISSQVEFLKSNGNVGMVYGNGLAIDAVGNPLFNTLPNEHFETGDPNRILLDCYIAIPGGSLIRRDVFDKAGVFNEAFRAGQDHDMAIRIFEVTEVRYQPHIVFHYRKHGDSISQKNLERRWRTAIKILQNAKSRYAYKASTLKKRAAVINFRLAQTLLRSRKNWLEACGRLLLAGLLDPLRALKVMLGQDKPL